MAEERLPIHERAENPPRMRLTERDAQVILAVYQHRVLRRDQIQRLFFPSRNTANARLKLLYHNRFLDRRFVPVEYGQGTSQALYLLDERGANVTARKLGVDRGEVNWRASHNEVGTIFLEHTLMVNDTRIAFTLAAEEAGYQVSKWIEERELKADADHVVTSTPGGRQRRVAVVPDGYFILDLGDKRAHFFLEVDRATESNKRWRRKIEAYQAYTRSGKYTQRYGTRSLRILTVTTGERRLANLKGTTEGAGGGRMFWFTTFEEAMEERILSQPVWQVAGKETRERI